MMTGSEIARVREALELIQCGKIAEARDTLVRLMRDSGQIPPAPPPGANAPEPAAARASA